ncbi:MAG: HepT-like ribonuclease domain-containing protein [bacterium]
MLHAYYDIDLDILWKIIIEDIPFLINNLKEIVKDNFIKDVKDGE